jgi:LacI family transcriptional regulator
MGNSRNVRPDAARRRTVGLLIESSRAYGRGLLRGIARYARGRENWAILHQEWNLDDNAPTWLEKGACDGVIARIETVELLRSLQRLGIPVVDVRRLHTRKVFPA